MVKIPVGSKFTATVCGKCLKECRCEACQTEYVYEVQRTASGEGSSLLWLNNEGARSRARERASQSLQRKLEKAIDPVPCPACGWLQSNMCRLLKWRTLGKPLTFGFVLGIVLLIWGLVISDSNRSRSRGLLTGAGALLGLMVVFGTGWYTFYCVGSPGTGIPAIQR